MPDRIRLGGVADCDPNPNREDMSNHRLDLLAYREHCLTLIEKLTALQWCIPEDPTRHAPGVPILRGKCPECGSVRPEHLDSCEIDAILAININNLPEIAGGYNK